MKRHELRWWDGNRWTPAVSDGEMSFEDRPPDWVQGSDGHWHPPHAGTTAPAWVVWAVAIVAGAVGGFVVAYLLAVGGTDQSGTGESTPEDWARIAIALLVVGPLVGVVVGILVARRALRRRSPASQ